MHHARASLLCHIQQAQPYRIRSEIGEIFFSPSAHPSSLEDLFFNEIALNASSMSGSEFPFLQVFTPHATSNTYKLREELPKAG